MYIELIIAKCLMFGKVEENNFATEYHYNLWVLSQDEINGWILFKKTEPRWTILWQEDDKLRTG